MKSLPARSSRSLPARVAALSLLVLVAGCGTFMKQDKPGKSSSGKATKSSIFSKKGGYYLDDGPGGNPPVDLASIPDAIPRYEPLREANMRPYVALGKSYTPMTGLGSYRERGIASWYGRRYHGQKTASGEIYDMYGMTGAHPILPLPSYVRVTNLRNGKSVVIRLNDRGPFLSDRLIDLSYTAAYKLDLLDGGSSLVEVETILMDAEPSLKVASVPAGAAATSTEDTNGPVLFAVAAPAKGTGASAPKPASSDPAPFTPTASIQAGEARQTDRAAFTADANGIYLQLGAFSAYDNADNFLTRIRAELPLMTNNLGIVAKDGLFKVHVGPYPDHAMARQAADKIAQTLYIRPMLLVR
ncbi:MAG TPA: septal ring lytic transglycosylase RlpA family protein [Nitrosospira sp.]|nr:septal ring lytic transglycosylase RlpA family protein [Nitrosospira sp.]